MEETYNIIRKPLIALVALIILVASLSFAIWQYQEWYSSYSIAQRDLSNPNVFVEELNKNIQNQLETIPEGLSNELSNSRIYFMLANKGSAAVFPYVFSDGDFTMSPHNSGLEPSYISFSPDQSKVTFFAVSKEHNDPNVRWHTKSYGYVYDTNALDNTGFLTKTLTDDRAVSIDSISLKQIPSVSNTGSVVFTGWDHDYLPAIEAADDWSIYHAYEGLTRFETNGYMAKWLDDITILFLRTDGLYSRNIETEEESLLAPSTATSVYSNSRFDISDDGLTLSWSRPESSTIDIYNITPDKTLTKRGGLSVRSFWNSISPSGKYLAVEAIRPNSIGNESDGGDPKIVFFDLSSLRQVPGIEFSMEAFESSYIYLTDWATK